MNRACHPGGPVMTPGGIRGRKLPQAWTPAAGMVHTGLQLPDLSVLALLKALFSAHPGRAGRSVGGTSRPAASSGQAGHHYYRAQARSQPCPGNTWPPAAAIRTTGKRSFIQIRGNSDP